MKNKKFLKMGVRLFAIAAMFLCIASSPISVAGGFCILCFVMGVVYMIFHFAQRKASLAQLFVSFRVFFGEEVFEGHDGGFFGIRKTTAPYNDIMEQVKEMGNIPETKRKKYSYLVKEKSWRVVKSIRSGRYFLTSYEDRDPNAFLNAPGETEAQPWGKWGGAIRISRTLIYVFSGFPELLDEAFVCWVALHWGTLSMRRFEKICERRKDNPFLQKMWNERKNMR